MLQRKGKLKGKTKDTFGTFLHFRPFWFLSFGGLFARINFKKSPHFTKSSFTRIALQRTPKQTTCGTSLFFVVDVVENIRYSFSSARISLSFALFSFASWSPRHITHDGQNALFFSVAFPLLVVSKKNFSDVSLSLSLSLCYHSEIVHIQAGQCGNQIGAKFWEVSFSRVKQLCSFLSFDDDDEHHFPFFSLPVG